VLKMEKGARPGKGYMKRVLYWHLLLISLLCVVTAFGCKREGEKGLISEAQQVGTKIFSNAIFCLDFLDNEIGWAAGSKGGIIHTTNGGKEWNAQESGVKDHIFDMHFINREKGWAVGEHGAIIHTSDGGENWQRQVSGTEEYLRAVFFIDEQRGFAAGEQGNFLVTQDGGATWEQDKKVTLLLKDRGKDGIIPTILDLNFLDSNEGWAIGFPSIILYTANGGNEWQFKSVELDEAAFYNIFFLDKNKAWLVGKKGLEAKNGILLFTEDSGSSWEIQQKWVTPAINHAYFTNHRNGWMVTYGAIMNTTDGGKTWTAQLEELDQWLYALQFSDDLNGWAVGSAGNIYYTPDGGKTWVQQIAMVPHG
jgi:photosystem II stability/assembly factor-like uncharacterized protein